jgi:hypothetical protein
MAASSATPLSGVRCGTLGASAFTFSMNAACSFSPSFGVGEVRVATGTPTSMKKFLLSGGRADTEHAYWPGGSVVKLMGRVGGMFSVSPARTVDFLPRKVASTTPSSRIKVSSKSCRCGGGPPPGGMCISITQKRPSVCSPVTVMVYVSPTGPM